MSDDETGERFEQLCHHIAFSRLAEAFDSFDDEGSYVFFELRYLSRREPGTDETAKDGVVGRVEKDDRGRLAEVNAGARFNGESPSR